MCPAPPMRGRGEKTSRKQRAGRRLGDGWIRTSDADRELVEVFENRVRPTDGAERAGKLNDAVALSAADGKCRAVPIGEDRRPSEITVGATALNRKRIRV